ncbi:transposase [Streptomyces sp. NPDC007856]|uniref:transposase n=1 Tax=Streptomyces sp. NPDC007856 TaxID=3364781 RepID=UPI0036BEFDC3
MASKKPALIEALTGQFEDHHARLLRVLLTTVDHLTTQISEFDQLITQALGRLTDPPPDGVRPPGTDTDGTSHTAQQLVERLDAIPGVGPATAQIILAEIGTDMSRFLTPQHLIS